MATADRSTDNKLGVNFKSTTPAPLAATPEYPGSQFKLGEVANGSDGSKYVFAAAPVAVPLGSAVVFDINWNANLLTNTNAAVSNGQKVGVASQTALAATERGWFQIEGLSPAILVAATTAANTQLYSSATPGQLSTTATGGAVAVNGVITTTLNGASAGVQPGNLNEPRVALP